MMKMAKCDTCPKWIDNRCDFDYENDEDWECYKGGINYAKDITEKQQIEEMKRSTGGGYY